MNILSVKYYFTLSHEKFNKFNELIDIFNWTANQNVYSGEANLHTLPSKTSLNKQKKHKFLVLSNLILSYEVLFYNSTENREKINTYQADVGINTHLNVFPIELNATSSHPQWDASVGSMKASRMRHTIKRGTQNFAQQPCRLHCWASNQKCGSSFSHPSSEQWTPLRKPNSPRHDEFCRGPAQCSYHNLIFPFSCVPGHHQV